MMLFDIFKNSAKVALRRAGIDIPRIQYNVSPPPLYNDPQAVIRKRHSHEHAALNCPLSECVAFNGMSFSDKGWHPFIQTAKEYIDTGVRRFENSYLDNYYTHWQPTNARDALIGATLGPVALDKFPSYTKHLPWSHRSVAERKAYMSRVIEIENFAFGNKTLTVDDGYGLHGPVSNTKGKLEYERIVSLVDSIQKFGFDRWRGDITVEVLKRDGQFRYIVTHGNHRVAVMAALGYQFIPVLPEVLLEDRYVDHWHSVYQNIWKREEALTYFNHLFDFNAKNWAIRHNLFNLE